MSNHQRGKAERINGMCARRLVRKPKEEPNNLSALPPVPRLWGLQMEGKKAEKGRMPSAGLRSEMCPRAKP